MLNTEKRTYCTPTSTVRPGACSTPPNTAATRRVWAVSLQNKFAYDKKLYTINTKNQSRAYTTPETNNERAPRGNEMKPKRPGYFSLAESTGTALCNPYRSTASENRSLPVKCTSIPATLWFINFKNTPFGIRTDAADNQKDKPFINFKFNTMKKQFLLLAVFTLATLFAGTNKVFGQSLDPSSQPIDPLSCISSSEPLHPFAGVPYTYALTDSTAEPADMWTWYATKDQTFIDGTTGELNVDDSLQITTGDLLYYQSHYGVPTADADSIQITWSTQILANTSYKGEDGTNTPTFVVGYATGENCADNIQVYEINPKPNFVLDVASVAPDLSSTLPWDSIAESCVSPVYSAIYNTTNYELDMNYGTDTIYFEIAAANFVSSFVPTFTLISGLEGDQEATLDLFNTLADASGSGTSLESQTWSNGADPWTSTVAFTATDQQDVADGVSFFLRVIIANNSYESLRDNPFTIAVDAQDDGGSGIWDMEDEDCGELVDASDQFDQATHIITPRPTLQHNTIDAGAPDPTDRVPKANDGSYKHF